MLFTVISRDLRIGNFRSNHESNRRLRFESNLELNQNYVIVHVPTDEKQILNEVIIIITDDRDMWILLVPQTILHDCSYSASECVCSYYIKIK